MSTVDTGYFDSLGVEGKRREYLYFAESFYATQQDLLKLPEIPSLATLRQLTHVAMNMRLKDEEKYHKRMRELQSGSQDEENRIPFKCEYENAQQLWLVIRDAILGAKK